MIFLFCLLKSFLCYGSHEHREPSRVLSSENLSVSVDVSSLTNPEAMPSEEDILCDMALSRYSIPHCDVSKFIKPYLVTTFKKSPKDEVLKKFRSGDNLASTTTTTSRINSKDDEEYIHAMVVQSIHDAFAEKDRILAKREAALKKKYSGKFVASLTVLVGGVSTILTSVCTALIAIYSKK